MAFGDDDLGVFFSDFAVDAVFNGVTAQVLLDAFDQASGAVPNVDASERITDVCAPTSAWAPFPKRGSVLTVDGTDMRVRDLAQEKDGALTHLFMTAEK